MTISQSLVLVLIVALWATGNNINIVNNTTLLIILLIALISLSFSTNYRRCQSNYQTTLSNQNLDFFNLFS